MFLNRFFKRIEESALIASLGDGAKERLRIFLLLLKRSVRHATLKTSDSDSTPLSLRFNGVPFSITVMSHEDIMLLLEIFCRRTYEYPVPFSPKVIVDLGANRGISTLFFCTWFPNTTIIAVEPNPILCELTRTRVAAFPHVTVVNAALAPHDGTVPFYLHPNSQASSLVAHAPTMKQVTVRGVTLSSLMREQHITDVDVLKFDIEGAEEFLLFDTVGVTAVKSFIGEVHEDLMALSLREFLSLIKVHFETTIQPLKKKGRHIITGYRND